MSVVYKDTDLVIRKATRDDVEDIHKMIHELLDCLGYNTDMTVEELQRHGFDRSDPQFECLLAELPKEASSPIGFALFFPWFSAITGPGSFLQNLFVYEQYRKRGIGDKLYAGVAKVSFDSGRNTIFFNTTEDSTVHRFYERHGAKKMAFWSYKLTGEALVNTAKILE